MSTRLLEWCGTLRRLLTAAALVAMTGTLACFFGSLWWPFELACSFRVQWFALLVAAAFACLVSRKYRHALIMGLYALPNLFAIAPAYFQPGFVNHSAAPTIRALLMNVNIFNTEYERVRKFIQSTNPDFVLVQEVNLGWAEALKPLSARYPFVARRAREDNFGIALYSRTPYKDVRITSIGHPGFPAVVATLRVHGNDLTIIGMHPPPPLWAEFREAGRAMLHALARLVTQREGPVMVLGDLNTTPWSPLFGDLLEDSGLRDSRRGFGIQATWPIFLPFALIPLDHCLISKGLTIANRCTGPYVGSDHYPVIIDFAFRAQSSDGQPANL